jgi:hypothetical protein
MAQTIQAAGQTAQVAVGQVAASVGPTSGKQSIIEQTEIMAQSNAYRPKTLKEAHKEAQLQTFSKMASDRSERSKFRAEAFGSIKEGIKDFASLSYEVADQGTPYVKGFLHSVNSSMPYKLVFLFLFFAVFYNVIYRICVFFGIDVVILNMYLGWVSFILVLFTFLPYEYGNVLDTPE